MESDKKKEEEKIRIKKMRRKERQKKKNIFKDFSFLYILHNLIFFVRT